jgi:hypothetical protein
VTVYGCVATSHISAPLLVTVNGETILTRLGAKFGKRIFMNNLHIPVYVHCLMKFVNNGSELPTLRSAALGTFPDVYIEIIIVIISFRTFFVYLKSMGTTSPALTISGRGYESG